MLKNEWKRLCQNPLLFFVLVVIALVPSIYAGFFLSSMWDPYGELDLLPVAVVNEDIPVEYEGKLLSIGEDLVENLAEDASLDFHVTDASTAEQGLQDGTYYMVITIPTNFSASAATVMDETPQPMALHYRTNPSTNYVAAKLGESAMVRLENSLQEKIVETYTETVFDRFREMGDSLQEAADGTQTLLDGEWELRDGVGELSDATTELVDGVSTLHDGTIDLQDGTLTLKDGLMEYLDGTETLQEASVTLDDGVQKLLDGSIELADGTQSLYDATVELSDGSEELRKGLKKLANGTDSLEDGTEALLAGIQQFRTQLPTLEAGVSGLCQGTETLSGGLTVLQNKSTALNSGLQQLTAVCADDGTLRTASAGVADGLSQSVAYLQAKLVAGETLSEAEMQSLCESLAILSAYAQGVDTGLQSLSVGLTQLETGVSAYTAGVDSAANGAKQLAVGTSTLAAAMPTLHAGLVQLEGGASGLNDGADDLSDGAWDAYRGMAKLRDGAGTLCEGAGTLNDATHELSDGVSTLKDGTSELVDGTTELTDHNLDLRDGILTLYDGTIELNDGVSELLDGVILLNDGTHELRDALPALTDGTTELRDALQDGADEIRSTHLAIENQAMFANPISTEKSELTTVENNGHAMSAYMISVGLWVGGIAFCLMYPLTTYEKLTGGFSWWLSKASVLYPLSLLQAVFLVYILRFALGFTPMYWQETLRYSCLISMAFLSVIYFFNAWLGKVGSFLMLIVMVLQLTGSAGTYPIELSGTIANFLHPYVPFTYTVTLLRSCIGGGVIDPTCVHILEGILIVFSLLTILLFRLRTACIRRNRLCLYDWIESKGFA